MKVNKILGFLAIIAFIFSACQREKLTELSCDNDIMTNSLLKDKGNGVDYVIDCPIRIRKGTLTIEDGVHIQFEGEDAGFIVEGEGALRCNGSSKKHIILEGKNGQMGEWLGVVVATNKSANSFSHTEIRHAGSKLYAGVAQKAGLVVYNEGNISISNSTISNNKGYGIYVQNGNCELDVCNNNEFTINELAPISIPFNSIVAITQGNSFLNNGQNWVEVWGQSNPNSAPYTLLKSGTISTLTIPYRLSFQNKVGSILSIQGGAELQFADNASLVVAGDTSNVALSAIGNYAQQSPVRFTKTAEGTAWRGIHIANSSRRNILEYCIIEYGGSQKHDNSNGMGNVVVGTSLDGGALILNGCQIGHSKAWGVNYRYASFMVGSGNFYNDNFMGDFGMY